MTFLIIYLFLTLILILPLKHNLQIFFLFNFFIVIFIIIYFMIFNHLLIPLLNISKFYNLPSDIIHIINFYVINNSAQLIINKWYSYIFIHNINLCNIINKIPVLTQTNFLGHIISYYNLYDINFNIALSICAKFIKPSISDKTWWYYIIQKGFNGLIFVDNHYDAIVQHNLFFLNKILKSFESF